MGFMNFLCCCVPCAQVIAAHFRKVPALQDGDKTKENTPALPPALPLDSNADTSAKNSGSPPLSAVAQVPMKKKSSSSLFSSPFKKRSSGTASSSTNGSHGNQGNTREVKLLILGPGESGKSTIVKQMKILHGSGYSKEELSSFKKDIYRNLLQAMQQTLIALKHVSIQFHSPEGAAASSAVENANPEDLDDKKGFPELLLQYILFLWNESGLKPIFDKVSQVSYVLCSAP